MCSISCVSIKIKIFFFFFSLSLSHFSSILAYNRNIMVIRKVFANLNLKPAETLFIAVTYAETLFGLDIRSC